MQRTPRPAVAAAAAAALLAACAPEPAGPDLPATAAAAGHYTLRSLDAVPVPAPLLTASAGTQTTAVNGTLVLAADGTCAESIMWRTTSGGTSSYRTSRITCRYVASRTAISFTFDAQQRERTHVLTGVRDAAGFTFVEHNVTYRYTR